MAFHSKLRNMEESFSKMRHSLFDCYEQEMAMREFQSYGRHTKRKVYAQGPVYKSETIFLLWQFI